MRRSCEQRQRALRATETEPVGESARASEKGPLPAPLSLSSPLQSFSLFCLCGACPSVPAVLLKTRRGAFGRAPLPHSPAFFSKRLALPPFLTTTSSCARHPWRPCRAFRLETPLARTYAVFLVVPPAPSAFLCFPLCLPSLPCWFCPSRNHFKKGGRRRRRRRQLMLIPSPRARSLAPSAARAQPPILTPAFIQDDEAEIKRV